MSTIVIPQKRPAPKSDSLSPPPKINSETNDYHDMTKLPKGVDKSPVERVILENLQEIGQRLEMVEERLASDIRTAQLEIEEVSKTVGILFQSQNAAGLDGPPRSRDKMSYREFYWPFEPTERPSGEKRGLLIVLNRYMPVLRDAHRRFIPFLKKKHVMTDADLPTLNSERNPTASDGGYFIEKCGGEYLPEKYGQQAWEKHPLREAMATFGQETAGELYTFFNREYLDEKGIKK